MHRISIFLTALALTFCTILPSSSLEAAGCTYYTDAGGCGYEECRTTPCLSPMIALGVVALAAIIALALQNSHGKNGHAHSSHCCDGGYS